ncbi:LOG family protein [Brachybacterium sp. DNPG3]
MPEPAPTSDSGDPTGATGATASTGTTGVDAGSTGSSIGTAAAAPSGRALQRVTLYCGSALGFSPVYAEEAAKVARAIAEAGLGVVYGGGRVGLMGTIADAARAAGGEVLGVIPQALMDKEVGHQGLTGLEVVPDMHTRKQRMADLGDAFVALPGGLGTLEELFEVWTWQQLGYHAKPVALHDVEGYWRPLIAAIDAMTEAGFLAERFRSSVIVVDEPQALLEALRGWEAPVAKWSGAADVAEASGIRPTDA